MYFSEEVRLVIFVDNFILEVLGDNFGFVDLICVVMCLEGV